jgi:hypothetical protein
VIRVDEAVLGGGRFGTERGGDCAAPVLVPNRNCHTEGAVHRQNRPGRRTRNQQGLTFTAGTGARPQLIAQAGSKPACECEANLSPAPFPLRRDGAGPVWPLTHLMSLSAPTVREMVER